MKRNERNPCQEPDVVFWKTVRKENAGRGGKKNKANGPLTHRANLTEAVNRCNQSAQKMRLFLRS
jgi:hypothetical protein